MPKMRDLGHRYDSTGEVMPIEEKEVYYPSETFTEEQLPALAGKNAGDEVTLTIRAKVKSVETIDREGKKEKTEYRLEFREGYCDESDSGSKSDKIAAMNSGEKKKIDDTSDDINRPKELRTKAYGFGQSLNNED